MFSSPLARAGRRQSDKKEISCPYRDNTTIQNPVEEFNYLLDRLNCLIEISNEDYQESLKSPTSGGSTRLGGLFFRRRAKKEKDSEKKKGKDGKERKEESKVEEASEKQDESETQDVTLINDVTVSAAEGSTSEGKTNVADTSDEKGDGSDAEKAGEQEGSTLGGLFFRKRAKKDKILEKNKEKDEADKESKEQGEKEESKVEEATGKQELNNETQEATIDKDDVGSAAEGDTSMAKNDISDEKGNGSNAEKAGEQVEKESGGAEISVEEKEDDDVDNNNKDNDENESQASQDSLPRTEEALTSSIPAATRTPDRPISSSLQHTPPPTPLLSTRQASKIGDAFFMNIAEEDECVEILRRIAELVVIGERLVSSHIVHEEKKIKHQQKKGWGEDITEDEDLDLSGNDDRELDPDSEQYLPIFDNFFERNGLGLIVDILTGAVFKQPGMRFGPGNINTDNPNSGEGSTEGTRGRKSEQEEGKDSAESDGENREPKGRWRFLPTAKVATQAVQSVSILVQNVSRATSLYFVLSNNHINELIGLPLDLYSLAERNRLEAEGKPPQLTGKAFTTPELQELTTHYVSFLKSLAMRMNAETLQFFLKYPDRRGEDDGASEETKAKAIEFPLYGRALDFCAPHHDTFVRVTSLNICLNTLRLTAVIPKPGDNAGDEEGEALGSSPDGVLHNANPLPFREALAIATHTCAPSRVSRLASPIFTKLAQLWGSLEEKFLDLDTPLKEEDLFPAKSKVPIDPIKERERKTNAFRETAASLQDQLLLLDDLLKVGLTALNEQIIEMMLATFVYPLLLQPLLVYYQQLRETSGEVPALLDPFAERAVDRTTVAFNEVGRAPPHVSAPAKTALFTLASVFHLISNRPLIRLLYTALFHPLAPAASGETVISAEGSVIEVNEDGKKVIRIDDPIVIREDERWSYSFGGKVEASSAIDTEVESCIFVLAPALAEVLKYSGKGKPFGKTRPNPYRRALLQCLEVPHHMSDFRRLSVMTVDAALSLFDGNFLADTLLGTDLADEAEIDKESGLPGYTVEVVGALCESLVNGRNGPFGSWKLDFDYIASHCLLAAVWRCPKALVLAEQMVHNKYRKAAGLLAEIPARIPTTQHLGTIMNLIFYDAGSKRRKATYDDLFHMKNTATERFSICIASASTFHVLCTRRGYEAPPFPEALNTFNETTVMILGSSSCRAMLKLDALSTFLKNVSQDEGSVIQCVNPFGFALTSDRGLVDTKECFVEDLARSIHSYISKDFCDALTDALEEDDSERPTPGSTVVLSGRTAMPCVCEIATETDTGNGAKMVVEGITWQSLYLVFFNSYMVLAEPVAGSAAKARVVTSCLLSRLNVARDPNQPADPSSPARRLLMAYKWFDPQAPPLFLYDEAPKEEGYGPFNKLKMWRSKLDVWFEDDGAAAHAYHSITFQIENARSRRGDRILDYLNQYQQ